ncbi:hypothetical protein C7M51_01937 [Mixta intestinalis]|jgi:hypothetical protein|uniref:Uncharacterized protein n=1 Tax=Mixta intestinalis TaxID=1615494 RepID=A0A6P1PYG0_9GAMM|nr:hypothetical protein C7M51_01937 [Mixta intestinalis]
MKYTPSAQAFLWLLFVGGSFLVYKMAVML